MDKLQIFPKFLQRLTINEKNNFKPLAKSVLIPLGLTAEASAADAGIHRKS